MRRPFLRAVTSLPSGSVVPCDVLSPYLDRWDNVIAMREARTVLLPNGWRTPEQVRTVLNNCERNMVTRPEPWPWEVR